MKQTRHIMGMPVTVEVIDPVKPNIFTLVFDYFSAVDARYSTYKPESEISRINRGLPQSKWSPEMKRVLALCDQTRQETNGYFDIVHRGKRDPSGLVKGWAINNAADLLLKRGIKNFYVEAGGDIQVQGQNAKNKPWSIGIRNPFKTAEIVKVLKISSEGVATSGTYIRGQHIYDPWDHKLITDVKSLTVIGPNVYEADRFATAAFAMGHKGINFIESKPGLEAYMITADQIATSTNGFERYVVNA